MSGYPVILLCITFSIFIFIFTEKFITESKYFGIVGQRTVKGFYEHISVSCVTANNDKRYYSTLFSNDLLSPREGTRNIR